MIRTTLSIETPRISSVTRIARGRRLEYFLESADPRFWDNHWAKRFSSDSYSSAAEGTLSHFEKVFTKYLPTQGRVLEAGCGAGQFVLALRVRGYECEGVEWGENTVKRVNEIRPDLPIRVGDVTRLDVPDGYYKGYISLGVVEHRQEGPEPFFREAYRVLSDDGIMLVSVPFLNPLRTLKRRLGWYQDSSDVRSFYQYAFTPDEMSSILSAERFVVLDTFAYDCLKGLSDELPAVRKLLGIRGIGWRLEGFLRSSAWARRNVGHMILYVCRKKAEGSA